MSSIFMPGSNGAGEEVCLVDDSLALALELALALALAPPPAPPSPHNLNLTLGVFHLPVCEDTG